jgi:8-oxo-dGTP pyrophosphatase MutT (NUDIX family)
VLPKGLVDPGESPADTALREGYEETGLRARLGSKLGDVRYVYTWEGERIFKIVSFYLAHATGGRIGALQKEMDVEVADVRWFPLDDAPELLAYGGERDMASRALDQLRADRARSDPL